MGADRIVLVLRPAERTKRDERDPSGTALVEHQPRRPIREVVRVLYTDDVGDLKGPQQVSVGDVADPDAGDQAFIPRSYQGAELVDKPVVYRRVVQQAQVDRGKSFDTERHKIVLDARAELIRVVVGQERAEVVPAATDLADQRQVVGIGGKCFPDKLI